MGAPRGFVQYNVMVEMLEQNGLTSQEIRRVAKECVYGEGTFDKEDDRGHYSSPFRGLRPDMGDMMARIYGEGWVCRLCNKLKNKYYLNAEGREIFQKLVPKFAGRTYNEIVSTRNFAEKYPALGEYQKNVMEKSARVACSNGIVLDESGSKPKAVFVDLADTDPVTLMPMRGLKLDDEVIYYRKDSGNTGEGYIQSVTETSKRIFNAQFEISIGIENATIPQIRYDEDRDRFVQIGGGEIEIVKKS